MMTRLRLTRGLPPFVRLVVDWVVTILGAIVVVLAIEHWVVAQRQGQTAASTVPRRHPPANRARRASASTRTCLIRERSITRPPSQVPKPARL